MIKRLVLFLLLLAAGFAALLLLVHDEPGAQTVKPEVVSTERPPASTGPTIVTKDAKGQEIGIKISGKLTLNTARYRLTCTDSAPVGDGLQRLENVVVELFDNGQHTANLKAKEATVELGRDERGQVSVKQDKDVLLQDAVFTSVPGPRLPPLRFDLQQARLHFVEQAVEVTTPGERDPVLLVIEGARPSRLEGHGLKARLPNSASQGARRLDAAVLHDPVFTTEQAIVRSRGRLDLAQDLETGSGRLTAVDDVRLELQGKIGLSLSGAGNADRDSPVTVTGDRLDAWLRHERQEQAATAASGRMQWTMLRITGAPALAKGQGSSLQGPHLSVLPDMDGRPFLLTAAGGATELVQTDAAGATSTFKAARNVHLLRPGLPAAAIHRNLGFPAWSLAQLERLEAAWFAGPSSATRPDGTSVAASDGLWLMRRGGDDASLSARGAGDVKVIRNEARRMVTASGNDGFRMTSSPSGDSLVFGPEAPVTAHRYTIDYGDMVVHGSGACAFERFANGRAKAVLRSVNPDIEGDLGPRGSVRGATAVDLELATGTAGATEIASLVASGPRVAGTVQQGGAFWNVAGARIERDHAGRWLLTGTPERLATLQLRPDDQQRVKGPDQPGEVSAPVILLYELGPRCAVLEARADGKARVEVITGPDRDGRSLRLLADQLRGLPCALPRRVLDAHLGGTGAALGWLPGFDLARPWLTASGNVVADITEPDDQRAHAECASVLLASGSQSALLIGDPEGQVPAVLNRAEPSGGTTFARAPRIQMDQSQGRTLRLLPTWPGLALSVPPRLELRDQHGRSTDALGNLAGTCRGVIEVLEDRVLFHGPVAAHALLPSGGEDPTGMHVTAEQLDMMRDPKTGAVILIEGHQGVRLDWSRITARSRELILDPVNHLCTVTDAKGAEVTLPSGMKVKTLQARANYQTRSLETWHGRIAMPSSSGDRTGQ